MNALKDRYPYYVANAPVYANADLAVTDKYSGKAATRVALADDNAVDTALARAVDAVEPMRALAAYERRDVLAHCVRRFTERQEELALALCVEAGKPIRDARGEVARLIDTFRVAAEESVRMVGETLPLDISPRARDYRGMWKRVPVGVCSFITPFNFPLNLVAHKVAPALAVGCPFVLEAGQCDTRGRADHRRSPGRDEAPARRVLDSAGARREGGALRRGPAHTPVELHRLARRSGGT